MMSFSSFSVSKTTEQTGSMTISRNAIWTGGEDEGKAGQQRQKRKAGDRQMDGKDIAHRLAQIVVDAPAEADGLHDRAEIFVEQDERRRLARHVGAAAAHGDANVGGLQGRRIVDAVAGHGDDFSRSLEREDDMQFLRRHDAGKDRHRFDSPGEFGVAHRGEVVARENAVVGQPGSLGDRRGGRRIVVGDHDDADARLPALS